MRVKLQLLRPRMESSLAILYLLCSGILSQDILNPKKCPESNSGCIFDDDIQGTECTVGGNADCKAVGSDYCSAAIGDPPRRVCCNISGANKIQPNIDIRGCPPSNQGCIYDDKVHGADCTVGGNADCFATGGDYCSAWFGYPPRRVCCTISDAEQERTLQSDDAHACPDSMSGCIYDDYVNGADCTSGGNLDCVKAGSDYCSAWVNTSSESRRVCCDISGDIPYGPAIANGSIGCPLSNRGCIFDDISVDAAKCTVRGNSACKQAKHDYCGAYHQDVYEFEPERVCCDIVRDELTTTALDRYDRTCPRAVSGCIYDDYAVETDCTVGGNPTCRAIGSDYCSAVFDDPPRRVCCEIYGVSKFHHSLEDIRGCPPANFGCIFDDLANAEVDCTEGGNKACLEAGSHYCSAWFGHPARRVCCSIARDTRKNVFQGTYEETCPMSTMGCIFDDHVHGADCTVGGNHDCLTNGSDYCGAWIGDPPKRQCCSISGPGPAPSEGDGSLACPSSNAGCIYDDIIDGRDCTKDGNEACIAVGAHYCSAFMGNPPLRVCCIISGFDDSRLEQLLYLTLCISGLIITVILIVFIIWYRINKQKQIAKVWRISPYSLHKYEAGQSGSTKVTSSINSLKSSTSSKGSELTVKKEIKQISLKYEIYFYKGSITAVQKHFAGAQLGKVEMIEMVQMREMTHENVNAFLGLCVDGPHILSVWKMCLKGCLLDLFEKENLTLDWIFKYSLIHDIVEGMDYLGKSALKKHGHLTSKSCLLDGRWQIKIGDYGLSGIRAIENRSLPAEEKLWTPPEILREPNKRHGIESDVYSIAIIIWEILARAAAWSNIEAAPKDIVYRVRSIESPPFRPSIEQLQNGDINPAILKLMVDCWEEKAEYRPNMRTIRHALRNMMRGKSTNLMDHVMHMMEEYAGTLEKEVGERTHQLHEEKKKTDVMLYRMLPRSVVEKMRLGQSVEPEFFDQVTVMSADVSGLSNLSGPIQPEPTEIVAFLSEIYNICDSIIEQYNVYKVESTTDGYLCASGVPVRNGLEHAAQIAKLSLALLKTITELQVPHFQEETVKIRIGIHTGPIVAGVVGMSSPRYCLFGECITIAARMAYMTKPNRIHLTEQTINYLKQGFETKLRGEITLKDVGVVKAYWLQGEVENRPSENQTEHFLPPISN